VILPNYAICRAVYVTQLADSKIRQLHEWENKLGRTIAPFVMRREWPEIQQTGTLSEEEWNLVSWQIEKYMPKRSDNNDDYMDELEFYHTWDLNLIGNRVQFPNIGKYVKKNSRLIDEVD
jgi:hypothetical protein